jgi:hypothetical protein
MDIRRRLAFWICPNLRLIENRLNRLRNELYTDTQWLGYDFPEIDVFAFRALVMDANYAREIGEKPFSLEEGGVLWSNDIATFRNQLREKFRNQKESEK